MASVSARPRSTRENLRAAICLLALIAKRPQSAWEERLPKDERNGDENQGNLITSTLANGEPFSLVSDDENHEIDFESLGEDLETIEVDEDVDKHSYLAALRDKVLDRLAETLSRFKSGPKRDKEFPLASKHVSSTLMIVYHQPAKVKFLCAKNEGLYQGGSTEDTDFLESWRRNMECISKRGPTAEEAKASLFTLVLNYQRPRINHYLKMLRNAFAVGKDPKLSSPSKRANLSETWLRELPSAGYRTWIDDSGNRFHILTNLLTGDDVESGAAESGDSLKNMSDEVDLIFNKMDKLCHLNVANETTTTQFTDSQEYLLKDLMASTLQIWSSVRHKSAAKSRLRRQFQDTQQGPKRQREVIMALEFLCRVHLAVVTFIDAAEKMPMFQSIEFVPVEVPPQPRHGPLRETPMEVAKRLGVRATDHRWADYLQQQATKDNFRKLGKQGRDIHAEIQILYHHDAFYTPTNERFYVHPYIGCSKLCCLLCYCFLRARCGFNFRGTHEAILHRWELPTISSTADSYAKLQSATECFLRIVIAIIQNQFENSDPRAHVDCRAQSSAALSTAQTVLDQELGQMERSQLNIRQLMTMPMVMDDGVLVAEMLGTPGTAYVMGGTLKEGREMSLQDAEIYKENHFRLKLGLEKQNEMPPRRESTARTCRNCRSPSGLCCSACRMAYCSRSCQRKDWKRHVFICAVRHRPHDFDRLGMVLSQRFRLSREEAAHSKFLVDLFSDDHLCRTFGFVNCFDSDEVANLFCVYNQFMRAFKPVLRRMGGNLGDLIESWARAQQANGEASSCHGIPWFLKWRAVSFAIPNWKTEYMYQVLGAHNAVSAFSLNPVAVSSAALPLAERAVISLYMRLFRDFNNVPDIHNSEWIDFGFCFCTNSDQRESLARGYLELAKSGASLGEVAHAWTTSSLSQLMKARGIDLSFFEANGIRFQRPDVNELGIYRLMAEVGHALSGRFCNCFLPRGHCHPKHETHLSLESDGDYGFYGTNAWERWQLLNFYNGVFQHPNFNAHAMQQAKRHPDHEKLEQYLDSLVPNFRLKIGHPYLADAMFPKLARVRFPHGHPHC